MLDKKIFDVTEEEIVSKEEAQEAMKRLVKFFQSYKGKFFGLDDLGIIDIYMNQGGSK